MIVVFKIGRSPSHIGPEAAWDAARKAQSQQLKNAAGI
jgi:hypothetical protein